MDPFVAEIRIFGFNFAPKGWAFCNGQLMILSQNTALFSLLGTTYGGDGKSTFQLPDLQGKTPMHHGQGPGLSLHTIGETSGVEYVSLLETQLPNHTHNFQVSNINSQMIIPTANALGRGNPVKAYTPTATLVKMGDNSLATSGGGMPHNNMMPYTTMNFCIALQGVFPPRP